MLPPQTESPPPAAPLGTGQQAMEAPHLLESLRNPADQQQTIDEPAPPPPTEPPEPHLPARNSEIPSAAAAWLMTVISAAIIVICSVWLVMLVGRQSWDEANGPRIRLLISEAVIHHQSGKLIEAQGKYEQVEQLVAGRRIRDAKLRQEIEQAREDLQQIEQRLAQQTRAPEPRPIQPPEPLPSADESRPAQPTAPAPPPAPTEPMRDPEPIASISLPQPPLPDIEKFSARSGEPPPRPIRPPPRPMALPSAEITDEQIGQAIERGVAFLMSQFNGPVLRQFERDSNSYNAGLDILCVYALLQAGQAINDRQLDPRGPFMKAALDALHDLPVEGSYQTYCRSLRATALAAAGRPQDRATLRADANWLVRAARNGAYTYNPKLEKSSDSGMFDNSNSQYGLLGAWSAAEVGIEVPATYWKQVESHWMETQHDSGEWGYTGANISQGRLSMTAAGLASLFVTHDYLDAPQFGTNVGRQPFSKSLARGLAWLEQGENCLAAPRQEQAGYTLYGLERVGLASGFKYFGRHDWYRELARWLVHHQGRNGSWGSSRDAGLLDVVSISTVDLVETSFKLLFLSRGRHPVLMNKLRFEGCWANRPRDVANLARFVSRELERPFNWQVVPIERDWTDWTDSPILYIASHEPFAFTAEHRQKLRRFIEAGGMVYTQADGDSSSFDRCIVDLGGSIFPEYEWTDLPLDHPIYTLNFQVAPRPKLRCITNGSRILMLHSPVDLARAWQQRSETTRRNLFELGANIFIYAAGKSDFRNRIASSWIAAPRGEPSFTLEVARVRYAGWWDPEPAALERFSRWFAAQTGYALRPAEVDLESLAIDRQPIALMTGTIAFAPTAKQARRLREFVAAGGVVLIDACSASPAFAASVETRLLPEAFADAAPVEAPPQHPILSGDLPGGDALPRPLLRNSADLAAGRADPNLLIIRHGQGAVVYSRVDLTTGLLGANTWGVVGFRPSYAQSLVKNVILWAADGCPHADDNPSAAPAPAPAAAE